MKKASLRAQILATANPKPTPVDVPAWGEVFIRPLTVGDLESFSGDATVTHKAARSIARVLCDEHGELIFDANNEEDLIAINGLRADSLQAINAANAKVNPASQEEVADLGNGSPRATDSSST